MSEKKLLPMNAVFFLFGATQVVYFRFALDCIPSEVFFKFSTDTLQYMDQTKFKEYSWCIAIAATK